MEKITIQKINSVIREAKALQRRLKNPDLQRHIKSLLTKKKDFIQKQRDYINLKKRRAMKTEKIYQMVVDALPDIEVDILKNGGLTIGISSRVPKDYDKLQLYLNNLIDLLERMKIFKLKKHIERIRDYLFELDSETEEEKRRYSVSIQEYKELSRQMLSEIANINQFLYPEQNVLVNIRDRFD